MNDFRTQLLEDFEMYRKRHPNIAYLSKDEWAFNYWILDNLFSVDEDLIEGTIVDYNDKGIDCYVWHEDQKDLYLIQNKFYSDNTTVSNSYIQNDFLTRAIGALEKGPYSRSKELQDIFSAYHGSDDFSVHFYLYITNNVCKTQVIEDGIAKFNKDNADKHYDARIFDLSDIMEAYYKEPITERKSFKYTLNTINNGTILKVDNEAYKMTLALDARYVLLPVVTMYRMYIDAQKKKYPLFDANIREYLGANGATNKKIRNTLLDPQDRSNFFFYNNGITMLVEDMTSTTTKGGHLEFDVFNPQVVNGCQTVSTIYDALLGLDQQSLEVEFKNTYVMVKILKVPGNNESLKSLYNNIVKYNNSQSSINDKNFIAIKDVFKHVQSEFEWRGFLVLIKQSDKNSFTKDKYKTATSLLNKNMEYINRFALVDYKNTIDFCIDLEKVLQVILSFVSTPQDAIQNKSKLLKNESIQNKKVVDFIKSADKTDNDLFYLIMLYLRAEQEKKNDGKMPNPFYLINCFARYECKGNPGLISSILANKESIDAIVKKYTLTIRQYYRKWTKQNSGSEYNDMIKAAVDYALLDECKTDAEDLIDMS